MLIEYSPSELAEKSLAECEAGERARKERLDGARCASLSLARKPASGNEPVSPRTRASNSRLVVSTTLLYSTLPYTLPFPLGETWRVKGFFDRADVTSASVRRHGALRRGYCSINLYRYLPRQPTGWDGHGIQLMEIYFIPQMKNQSRVEREGSQ